MPHAPKEYKGMCANQLHPSLLWKRTVDTCSDAHYWEYTGHRFVFFSFGTLCVPAKTKPKSLQCHLPQLGRMSVFMSIFYLLRLMWLYQSVGLHLQHNQWQVHWPKQPPQWGLSVKVLLTTVREISEHFRRSSWHVCLYKQVVVQFLKQYG